jgi:peptidoglycan/LPS O-acetylase OafA/YrhL
MPSSYRAAQTRIERGDATGVTSAVPNDSSTLRGITRLHTIPGLDALRAAAVLMVMGFHLHRPVSGPLGVVLFFVLSGFLITTLLLREFEKTSTLSFRDFYRRRAYRILPAYYVSWIIYTAALWLHRQPIHKGQALATLFFLTDYARAVLPVSLQMEFHMTVTWSVAVEEQFYLVWPVLLLVFLRKPSRTAKRIALLILTVWIWRIGLVFLLADPAAYIHNAFDTRLDALAIGALVAVLAANRNMPGYALVFLRRKWMLLVSLLPLALLSWVDLHRFGTAWGTIATLTLEPIFSSLLLLQVIFWSAQGWAILGSAPIRFIARLSYSAYLYHIVVYENLPLLHIRRGRIAELVVSTFFVAAASYYGVERPFLRLRDRRSKRDSVLLEDGLRHS